MTPQEFQMRNVKIITRAAGRGRALDLMSVQQVTDATDGITCHAWNPDRTGAVGGETRVASALV
jgi:hypothetical protein